MNTTDPTILDDRENRLVGICFSAVTWTESQARRGWFS